MRTCSCCGREMTEGYVIDGGIEYYCSDECLHTKYTHEEWAELYGDGDTQSYWTQWEEDDEEDEDEDDEYNDPFIRK